MGTVARNDFWAPVHLLTRQDMDRLWVFSHERSGLLCYTDYSPPAEVRVEIPNSYLLRCPYPNPGYVSWELVPCPSRRDPILLSWDFKGARLRAAEGIEGHLERIILAAKQSGRIALRRQSKERQNRSRS